MGYIAEENIDVFERFLSGEMNKEELASFEARIAYDSDFKQQLETYRSLEKDLKNHFREELKKKLIKVDRNYDESGSNNRDWKMRNTLVSLSLVAVIIIGLLIVPSFFDSNGTEKIVQKNWAYDEGLPVLMSRKSTYDDAMNNFKQGRWEKTINSLDSLTTDTAYFYKALSYYNLSEHKNALSNFEKINSSSEYFADAQFRTALLYLIIDKSKGIKLLKEIANSKSSEAEKAKMVIEEINAE